MIKLSMFKDSLDFFSDSIKRLAKRQSYSLEYLKGKIDGIEGFLTSILPLIQYPELIKVTDSRETNLVGYVDIFDVSYPVYMDDYGQCFYTKIDNKEYSFGTYNTDIIPELISIVLTTYMDRLKKEIENIYNLGDEVNE